MCSSDLWSRFGPTVYFTGDGARTDDDGDIWLLGRVDDVINVSGHRISTTEIEHSLVGHPGVAELLALRDVLEQAAHDLARARLRQVGREQEQRRPREAADVGGDVLRELGAQVLGRLHAVAQDHEGGDVLDRKSTRLNSSHT